MKKKFLTFLILSHIFIAFTFCYLRKHHVSPRGSNYIFPKTVQSIQPYIVNAHRHVNVLPTLQGPMNPQSIKVIQFGLDQSRIVNNRLRKKREKCKCKDILSVDLSEPAPIVLSPPRLVVSPCETGQQTSMVPCKCESNQAIPQGNPLRKKICYCPCENQINIENNYQSHRNSIPGSLFNTQTQRNIYENSGKNEVFGFPLEIFDKTREQLNRMTPNTQSNAVGSNNYGDTLSQFRTLTPLLTFGSHAFDMHSLNNENQIIERNSQVNNNNPGQVINSLLHPIEEIDNSKENINTSNEITAGQVMNSAIDYLKNNEFKQ